MGFSIGIRMHFSRYVSVSAFFPKKILFIGRLFLGAG